MKPTYILMLSLLFIISGCSNDKTKNQDKEIANPITTQNEVEASHTSANTKDNYVGNWVDINHDPNDPNETEIFKISKLHDREYQIGTQTGILKVSEKGAEYLSLWIEEYGAEAQFLYDNYTDHLILRTPFFTKELLRK